MSKNRSGEDAGEKFDVDEEFEFRFRRSTAASLQNSTHRGVLVPESTLGRREKFDPEEQEDEDEEEEEDDPLMDLCF